MIPALCRGLALFSVLLRIVAGELVVSEILYSAKNGNDYQFIELFNTAEAPLDLEGYSLLGSINHVAKGQAPYNHQNGRGSAEKCWFGRRFEAVSKKYQDLKLEGQLDGLGIPLTIEFASHKVSFVQGIEVSL